MSLFKESVLKAVSDYRQILRRLLDQPDRVRKLGKLGLRAGVDPDDEVKLYELAWTIVNDVEQNLASHNHGYYAYSGVRKFGEFLREFLEQYDLINEQVVHLGQHVAKSMLLVIQLVGLPEEKLDDSIAAQLHESGEIVFKFGTKEQQQNFMKALKVSRPQAPDFYEPIIAHFVENSVGAVLVEDS